MTSDPHQEWRDTVDRDEQAFLNGKMTSREAVEARRAADARLDEATTEKRGWW